MEGTISPEIPFTFLLILTQISPKNQMLTLTVSSNLTQTLILITEKANKKCEDEYPSYLFYYL